VHELQTGCMGIPIDMNAITQTYRGLLADVAKLTNLREIRGSVTDLHWCLNEAPKLEKHILNSIENNLPVMLDEFPYALRRLAAGSIEDPVKLRFLRQLLLFSYKAYVQHDNKTTQQAFETFAATNEEVGDFGSSFSKASPILLQLARKHVHSVLYRFKHKNLEPSHGPGASTTPKARWTKWYTQIERLYPYSDYYACYFNSDHLAEFEHNLTDEHIEAKLIAVPKDSRGPRLICVHPSEAIWLQQGLRRELERVISLRRDCKGPWPSGRVHFDNQEVNGRIALISSKSRKYATLDMKEASDRISDVLLQSLMGRHYKYFGCCRAQKYVAPQSGLSGFDSNIHSYAPMGNATTFPVQSLVFWAICCASMQHKGFHQPGAVFVFGDDIIVPTSQIENVINGLEMFGLVVNKGKTFWRSHFRESCGVDAYKGINVTPVRWKCSANAEHISELQSISDLAMRLRIAGYENAACELYDILRRRLRSRFHVDLFLTNNPNHGSIAEYTTLTSLVFRDAYWHRDLQKYVSPVYQLKPIVSKRAMSGWNHVLESLVSLRRTGRSNVPDRSVSRRTRLTRGWTDIL